MLFRFIIWYETTHPLKRLAIRTALILLVAALLALAVSLP